MSAYTDSPAIRLVRIIWNDSLSAVVFSWERLNHSLHKALCLAITSGLQFNEDDFATIDKDFKFGRWGSDGEHYYSLAVAYDHMSACKAFEKWNNRTPIIVDQVEYPPAYISRGGQRKRGRVCCAAKFKWNNETVTVTSFNDKLGHIVACSYCPSDDDNPWKRDKVLHVYKITRKDVLAARKAAKESGRTHDDMPEAVKL